MSSHFTLLDNEGRDYNLIIDKKDGQIQIDRSVRGKKLESIENVCNMIMFENACRFDLEELIFADLKEIINNKFYIANVGEGLVIMFDGEMYYLSNMFIIHMKNKDYDIHTSFGDVTEVDYEAMTIVFETGAVIPLFFIPEYLDTMPISPINTMHQKLPFAMIDFDDFSYTTLRYDNSTEGMLVLKVGEEYFSSVITSTKGLDKDKILFVMLSLIVDNDILVRNMEAIIDIIFKEFR